MLSRSPFAGDARSMARERSPGLIPFDEVAFRYSDYDTPFWVRSNGESGRWHQAGDGATQYLSTTVDGAWAELIRAEGLRSEDEVSLIRMPMWVTDPHVRQVADYSTFEIAAAAGFSPDALIDDDYSRCQPEGSRLRELGFQGVLAPSAALPGATNLTLFGPRLASSWGRDAVLASSIPAGKLAIGAPPEGIVERVRHFGEPHVGYVEYMETVRARRKGGQADPEATAG